MSYPAVKYYISLLDHEKHSCSNWSNLKMMFLCLDSAHNCFGAPWCSLNSFSERPPNVYSAGEKKPLVACTVEGFTLLLVYKGI